jgi:hypothetical protein
MTSTSPRRIGPFSITYQENLNAVMYDLVDVDVLNFILSVHLMRVALGSRYTAR